MQQLINKMRKKNTK